MNEEPKNHSLTQLRVIRKAFDGLPHSLKRSYIKVTVAKDVMTMAFFLETNSREERKRIFSLKICTTTNCQQPHSSPCMDFRENTSKHSIFIMSQISIFAV